MNENDLCNVYFFVDNKPRALFCQELLQISISFFERNIMLILLCSAVFRLINSLDLSSSVCRLKLTMYIQLPSILDSRVRYAGVLRFADQVPVMILSHRHEG